LRISAFGAAWESSKEAESFRKGDIASVKRILQKETYSEALILEAFPTAITSGNVELIKYLASLGWMEVCRKDQYCMPIHLAARYGRVDAMKFFISQGFDVHAITAPTKRGGGGKNSALHLAAKMGNLDAAKFLCEQGVDADLKNEYGRTALGDAKYTASIRSLGATKKEDARNRAKVSKVIEYLESGQCKKK